MQTAVTNAPSTSDIERNLPTCHGGSYHTGRRDGVDRHFSRQINRSVPLVLWEHRKHEVSFSKTSFYTLLLRLE